VIFITGRFFAIVFSELLTWQLKINNNSQNKMPPILQHFRKPSSSLSFMEHPDYFGRGTCKGTSEALWTCRNVSEGLLKF
jgi:hypothetical protein